MSRLSFLDQPIQVDVNERQTGARSPMSEQPVLDVLRLKGLFEQWVFLEIDHPERQVLARSPVSIGFSQFVGAQG